MMENSPKQLFEAAKYQKIIDLLESKRRDTSYDKSVYVVGALVFLGREEEAHEEAKAFLKKKDEAFIALFFLLLSAVRRQDFARMNQLIGQLYQAYRASSSSLRAKFFLYQAMGILSYYKGEFSRAEENSRKALRLGLELGDSYLCLISNDLLGHSLCMREQYSQGLRHFDDSERFSKKISNNSNKAVIDLAKMTYKIEAGWDLSIVEGQLLKWIASIKPQDYFTKTNAMLLKAKLLMLKGDFKGAESSLNEVSRAVYEFNHARKILDYNLLMSQLSLTLNDPERALALIRTSQQLCQEGRDFYSMMRFKELEGFIEGAPPNEELRFLTRKTGRIFRKEFPLTIIPEAEAHTKLKGINSREGCKLSALEELEGENLLGLICLSGIYPSQNFIEERLPERILLINLEGKIHLIRGLTSQQHQLVKLLISRHIWTKKELVEEFWQTPYDSFIHDNKVYVTLKRLKSRLGLDIFFFKRGAIITKEFKHYRDEEGVKEFIRLSRNLPEELNLRQRSLLEKVKSGHVIKPSQYSQLFGISRNTSSRDLSGLEGLGFVKKYGKGPGTYYSVI